MSDTLYDQLMARRSMQEGSRSKCGLFMNFFAVAVVGCRMSTRVSFVTILLLVTNGIHRSMNRGRGVQRVRLSRQVVLDRPVGLRPFR